MRNCFFLNTLFVYNVYRVVLNSFWFRFHTSSPAWLLENHQLIFLKKSSFFFTVNFQWNFAKAFLRKMVKDFSLYVSLFQFKWFRFVLFSGLGYKRRFLKKLRIMFAYTADRHWILYKFGEYSTVVPTKKRNFIFFSSAKGSLSADYGFFSNSRDPYVYKTKGFLDRRVKRRFLFARRIKLKKVKTKLSKKQKML